ncbi:MAG: hypothetical protein JXR36_11780 [Bacteroidales bacterium]|nr:hypothetical protein [Bacteroidales bacterium]
MTNYDAALQKLIDDGYEFKFNQYMRDGFELFKKEMGSFVGFFAAMFGLFVVLNVVLGNYSGIVTNLVQPAFAAGALLVANDILMNRKPGFNRFFDGFKFFIPLLLLSIVSGVLIMIGLLFLIVPGVYLAVSYSFANMLVIFLGYDFWPAMDISRKIVSKHWWDFFGFALVLGLINLGGILACGVGVIFTAPATLCMTYCAFEDIVGGAIRDSQEPSQPVQILETEDE